MNVLKWPTPTEEAPCRHCSSIDRGPVHRVAVSSSRVRLLHAPRVSWRRLNSCCVTSVMPPDIGTHTLLRRQHSHQRSSFSRHAAVSNVKLSKLGLIIAVAATATTRQHDQHESHVGNCGFLEANCFCHHVFNV
jgi:hypothetical protein